MIHPGSYAATPAGWWWLFCRFWLTLGLKVRGPRMHLVSNTSHEEDDMWCGRDHHYDWRGGDRQTHDPEDATCEECLRHAAEYAERVLARCRGLK